MSTAVVSTSAAQGRRFVFEEEDDVLVGAAALGCPVEQSSMGTHTAYPLPGVARHDSRGRLSLHELQSAVKNQQSKIAPASVTPASRLEIRPVPEMVSSGITALDALTGGLPRGCLTEICGLASSGRTTVLLAVLAAATRRGEFCVVVDGSDALDPQSAAAAGVELDCLLWVRCGEDSPQKNRSPQRHRGTEKKEKQPHPNLEDQTGLRNTKQSEHSLEQALRATDLLLESGGFGLIVLDLADLPLQAARRIPLTTWFRFRRAIEHTPTILLAIEQQPIAGSCSSLLLRLEVPGSQHSVRSSSGMFVDRCTDALRNAAKGPLSHAELLTGFEITAELICSRLERKPTRSVVFAARTAWAG